MFERRSLRFPITLAVTMILLIVLLTIGWVLINVFQASWVLLAVGTAFLVLVLIGVVLYLTLTIKAISLSQRQSNFIDSVTHELKSPIASLKLCLQTLGMRQVSDEQRESFHRFMLDDVERLDNLINHLLDAARLERRSAAEPDEEVELSDVIRSVAEIVCLRYRVPKTTIELDLEPCLVRARAGDLEMIFRNLLDNAVKYGDDEPHVGVTLRAGRDHVTAQISDNGRGIPLALRRQIFGRFVRLGRELEREKPGTGLGLYIVRNLVGRLRGRIRLRDREGGTGTVFEVQLPGRAVPNESVTNHHERQPQTHPGGRGRAAPVGSDQAQP